MSAPTAERTRRAAPRGTSTTGRGPNPGPQAQRVPAQRGGSGAVDRAYARRADRQRRVREPADPGQAGRPRFVLMVMGLLGAGLVASLWLSTSAAADSYRLEQATRAARDLSERSESLRTEIAALRSAPVLARSARDLGMVPVSDVARLVAMPDGKVTVVGTPKAGVAPAPPPPAVLPDAAPPPGTGAGVAPDQNLAEDPTTGPVQTAVPGQTVPPQTVVPGQTTAPGQTGAPAGGSAVPLAAGPAN